MQLVFPAFYRKTWHKYWLRNGFFLSALWDWPLWSSLEAGLGLKMPPARRVWSGSTGVCTETNDTAEEYFRDTNRERENRCKNKHRGFQETAENAMSRAWVTPHHHIKSLAAEINNNLLCSGLCLRKLTFRGGGEQEGPDTPENIAN